ncbi:uncharacterized protein BX664DRAFT_342563 [Halteromyces radiatus]|uniref:uncharacterized protein n=1 Tax=Halteromyces radiatus TaxID=101107 RepID=UPI00222036C7|nr:uncharacterized protein BX664DRAFT_342563 [Halteromyces radiatus]KAI8078726.1 hypothetical protein BX664DRAFT_342563 [Halteromyces radiatus]
MGLEENQSQQANNNDKDKTKQDRKNNDINAAISTAAAIAAKSKDTTDTLELVQNNHGDNHPIPSLSPVPHHAPPQDSSELLSPWWSEEPPNDTEPEGKAEEELTHFLVRFSRQATKNGDDLWNERCYIWTKEPSRQKESNLVNEIKQINKDGQASPKKTYPMNSQCTMVCLFRESQARRKKKLVDMNLSSSWNPFYGNWLVVSNTRSGFTEHLHETDITKANSPDYYTVELGERFGRTGEDVAKFMKKTFSPVQELGRRYIESWKDGTQVGFFTRFLESAKRGDAFFLLRDSARRIVENMANDEKKKDDDDHKR